MEPRNVPAAPRRGSNRGGATLASPLFGQPSIATVSAQTSSALVRERRVPKDAPLSSQEHHQLSAQRGWRIWSRANGLVRSDGRKAALRAQNRWCRQPRDQRRRENSEIASKRRAIQMVENPELEAIVQAAHRGRGTIVGVPIGSLSACARAMRRHHDPIHGPTVKISVPSEDGCQRNREDQGESTNTPRDILRAGQFPWAAPGAHVLSVGARCVGCQGEQRSTSAARGENTAHGASCHHDQLAIRGSAQRRRR